jgi:hypothetical protein
VGCHDCDRRRRRGCTCVIRRDRRARTASLQDGPMTVSPGIHHRTRPSMGPSLTTPSADAAVPILISRVRMFLARRGAIRTPTSGPATTAIRNPAAPSRRLPREPCIGTRDILHRRAPRLAFGEAQGRYASALVCAHLREDADLMGRPELPWFSPVARRSPRAAPCPAIKRPQVSRICPPSTTRPRNGQVLAVPSSAT